MNDVVWVCVNIKLHYATERLSDKAVILAVIMTMTFMQHVALLMDRCCMNASTIRSVVTMTAVRQAPKPSRACCLPAVQSVTQERYYSRRTEQRDWPYPTWVMRRGGDTLLVTCGLHSMLVPLSWMIVMWTYARLAFILSTRVSIQTATLTR